MSLCWTFVSPRVLSLPWPFLFFYTVTTDRRRDMIGTKGTCLFLKPAVSTRRCFRCRRKSVIFFFLLYSCETGSSIWALQPVTKGQSAQFSSSQTEGLHHQYQACCVLMKMHLEKKFLTLQCRFSVHRCQRQFSLLLLDVRCAFQVAYSNNHTPNYLCSPGATSAYPTFLVLQL